MTPDHLPGAVNIDPLIEHFLTDNSHLADIDPKLTPQDVIRRSIVGIRIEEVAIVKILPVCPISATEPRKAVTEGSLLALNMNSQIIKDHVGDTSQKTGDLVYIVGSPFYWSTLSRREPSGKVRAPVFYGLSLMQYYNYLVFCSRNGDEKKAVIADWVDKFYKPSVFSAYGYTFSQIIKDVMEGKAGDVSKCIGVETEAIEKLVTGLTQRWNLRPNTILTYYGVNNRGSRRPKLNISHNRELDVRNINKPWWELLGSLSSDEIKAVRSYYSLADIDEQALELLAEDLGVLGMKLIQLLVSAETKLRIYAQDVAYYDVIRESNEVSVDEILWWRYLKDLSADERNICVLYHEERLDREDIARRLKCATGEVDSKLGTARYKYKQQVISDN